VDQNSVWNTLKNSVWKLFLKSHSDAIPGRHGDSPVVSADFSHDQYSYNSVNNGYEAPLCNNGDYEEDYEAPLPYQHFIKSMEPAQPPPNHQPKGGYLAVTMPSV